MSMGLVVCAGIAVPITSVRLDGGKLVITAERPGPLRAASGPVVLYGADGAPAARADYGLWPRCPAGRALRVAIEFGLPDGCAPSFVPGELVAPAQVTALA